MEGYITKDNLDFGIKNLWKKNNVFSQFHDVFEAIKYALPEATIITDSDGKRGVEFRGTKSIEYNNKALIVVDGMVIDDPGFLPPSSIYRITKLTSTASALYGSRAANGVVNIETK